MKVAKSPSLAKSPERPLNTSNRATGARKGASDKEKALEFKNKGNAAFQKGEYQAAIQFFSRGIELDPTNPTNYIFYSNRSAAYFALPDYKRALEDADMVLKLKPDWPKGYSRKGAALVGCKRLEEAISAYKAGLAYDSSNALLLEGLEVAQNALAAAQGQSGRIGTTRSAALTPPHGNGFIVESPASLLPRAKPPSPSHRTAATPSGPLADIAGYQRRESADWHIMAFEDRIWLAHETVSYRPVTIFVFDNGHTVPVFLGIKSHHHPTPAPPELVYEVILTLCARFQVQPASVNVVPLPLYEEVAPAITAVGIPCTAHPPSEALLTAVQQQIARMEKEQEEQWSQTGIHQGTVWQRHLPGLLKVEGVTRSLLEGLMRNAAAYVRHGIRGQFPPERDDNYLLLTIGHSTTVASVVLANSKTSGKITGIARHVTLNDFLEPSPMVNQVSYLFTDPTGIPFDDLTDIKTYQWDIADDHSYPLALVYRPDHTNARPSAEELQWFEIAFSTLTEYVNFCRTYGEADPSVLTAPLKVTASTHAGQVVVIVTPPAALVPPGGEITAAQVPAVQEPDALVGLPPPPAPPAHSVVSQDISASQAVAPVPAVPATPAVAATHSFIPSAAFQGARQGYVFRNGDQGVGYYLDALAASVASAAAPTPPSPPIMAPAPQADGFQPFIPATGFEGKKSGYVFRIGTNGLGYYLDEVQLRELGIVPQTPPAHQAVQQPASQPLNPAAVAAQQAREAYERAQREGQQQRQGGLDATIQQPHNEPNRGTQQVMDQIEMLRAQMEALQHQNAELQRQLISTLTSATPQQPSHPVEPAFSQPQQSQPPQNQNLNPIPPPALPVTQEVLLQQLQQLQPGQPVPAQLLQMVSLLQQQQPQQQQQEQQQEPQQQQQQQQQLQQFQQQQQQQQQLQQHQQAHAIQQPAHQQQASSSYTATQYNSPGTQYQPHSQQFPQPRPAFSQPPVFPPQAPGYIPTGSRPATTPGWSAPTAGNPYTNDLLSKNVRYPVHRGGFAPPGPDMTPAFQPAPYYPSSPAHSPATFDAPFSPGRRSPVPFDLGAPMPRPPPGRPGYEDRFAPRFGAAPPPNFGRRPPIGGPRARPGQYPSSPEWAPPRQPAIGRYQLPSPSEPLMIEYPRRDGRFR